jgi:hypothetical protein
MVAAFDGVYLIQLDVDEWGWGRMETGFDFEAIPVFFRLDAEGNQTGDWIDGTAWGANTYINIANALGPWFSRP